MNSEVVHYFHGFRNINFDTLNKVLSSGFILARCDTQQYDDCNNIFNGTKWISLSQKYDVPFLDYGSIYEPQRSYDNWIYNQLCVVLDSKKLDDIKFTDYINRDLFSNEEFKDFTNDNNSIRYSYYLDEVQTNKPIPISSIVAVGYPVELCKSIGRNINEDIEMISSWLKEYKLNVPILNSSIYNFADNKCNMEKSKILNI